ncbi:MAG: hypothetical protein WBQ49_03575, partial [Rhodomicrobium sp.]
LHGSRAYARPYDGPGYPYYGPGYDSAPYDRGYNGAYEEGPARGCEQECSSYDPRTGAFATDSREELAHPYSGW